MEVLATICRKWHDRSYVLLEEEDILNGFPCEKQRQKDQVPHCFVCWSFCSSKSFLWDKPTDRKKALILCILHRGFQNFLQLPCSEKPRIASEKSGVFLAKLLHYLKTWSREGLVSVPRRVTSDSPKKQFAQKGTGTQRGRNKLCSYSEDRMIAIKQFDKYM